LEISRSKVQDLGVLYPGSVTFTPTPSGTGSLVLGDLGKQTKNTIQISNISATLNAMKQTGQVNTLASPRIRARNKEKAKVLIGTREPVITNTTTPTAGGTAVVTGSVQYLDVGLTLEVQPTVYPDSDVAIKINLEVSNLLKQVTTQSGTIAYEIGTRNANTLLRLRDGETQILAGLIQDSDTRSATSIPGLGDIPILSHLFGTHHTDREKDEIVLSITPRIIRMQAHAPGDKTEFWYGSETHTRGAPYSAAPGGSAPPPAPTDPTRMNMQPAIPNPGQPSAVPQTSVPASGATPPQTNVTPASAAAAAAVLAAAALEAAPRGLAATTPPTTVASNAPASQTAGVAGATAVTPSALTLEGPNEATVGDEFQVVVRLATDESITHLRSQLRFDPAVLHLLSADTGDMVPAAAGSPKVNTRADGAQLDVKTTSDSPVQGQGSLMTVQFKAVEARPATIQAMLNVLGGSGAAVANSTAPPLTIAIRPAG
jgi:general secretion pathway protein D